MVSYLVNNAGTSAYLAAGFAIISFAALFIFFAGVAVFGPINDFLSIFQMLFLIPVALALYQLLRSTAPVISLLTTAGAVLALTTIAVLQILLVVRIVTFEFTLRPILILGVVLGIWWLAIGLLAFISGTLPSGLAWTMHKRWGQLYGHRSRFLDRWAAASPRRDWFPRRRHRLTCLGDLAGLLAFLISCNPTLSSIIR